MKQYFRHKIENLISVKNIITIEYLNLSKDYLYPTENHNFWEFVYVDQQSVFCTIEDETLELHKGEILFHKPQERHSIFSNHLQSPTVFIICFECNSQAMSAFEKHKSALSKSNKLLLANIIEEMKTTFCFPFNKKLIVKDDPALGGQQVIRTYLELLLILLLRELTQTNDTNIFLYDNDYENQLAKLVKKYLKDNIQSPLRIEDICKKLNYSRSYLSKIFKEKTGYSIIDYFNYIKIKEAKRMLTMDNVNITQVSDYLGFSNPHYFSSLFKKLSGCSPSQFLNSIER